MPDLDVRRGDWVRVIQTPFRFQRGAKLRVGDEYEVVDTRWDHTQLRVGRRCDWVPNICLEVARRWYECLDLACRKRQWEPMPFRVFFMDGPGYCSVCSAACGANVARAHARLELRGRGHNTWVLQGIWVPKRGRLIYKKARHHEVTDHYGNLLELEGDWSWT